MLQGKVPLLWQVLHHKTLLLTCLSSISESAWFLAPVFFPVPPSGGNKACLCWYPL